MLPLTLKRKVLLIMPADDKVGGVTERTVTLKYCVALKLGVPLSATTIVKGLIVCPCEINGRQFRMPLEAFITALLGATGIE